MNLDKPLVWLHGEIKTPPFSLEARIENDSQEGDRRMQASIQAIRRGHRMKASKRKKLESTCWKVGTASEFLELSDSEAMLVNMKLTLAKKVKELRQSRSLSQHELAKLIGSSQSRVAKLESADRSVSMELLVRSLAALGASRADRQIRRC